MSAHDLLTAWLRTEEEQQRAWRAGDAQSALRCVEQAEAYRLQLAGQDLARHADLLGAIAALNQNNLALAQQMLGTLIRPPAPTHRGHPSPKFLDRRG